MRALDLMAELVATGVALQDAGEVVAIGPRQILGSATSVECGFPAIQRSSRTVARRHHDRFLQLCLCEPVQRDPFGARVSLLVSCERRCVPLFGSKVEHVGRGRTFCNGVGVDIDRTLMWRVVRGRQPDDVAGGPAALPPTWWWRHRRPPERAPEDAGP